MRVAPIFLTLVCSTLASFALADTPVVAETSTATATPAPAATTTAVTTSVATTTEQAAKPEVTDAQIKEMRSAGYKMETRKGTGQTVFCKSQAQIGTRFESKVCGSYDDLKRVTVNSQEFTSKMQQQTAVKGGN
jgi:hypothetical protein